MQEPKPTLTLDRLGWNEDWHRAFAALDDARLEPGRIVLEDKHHYVVVTSQGVFTGRIAGKLLHQAESKAALPKVGDWVALTPLPNEEKAVIHHVLPRRTTLSRKLPGRETTEQMLVTNVDEAFIVLALDEPLNARLLERFLLMVIEGGIKPVIVLNKSDLCDKVEEQVRQAEQSARAAPVLAVSARTGRNMKGLAEFIRPRSTAVFIGQSGVGKSSLINKIYGEEVAATVEVRESDRKGRHTTTWRELIVMPNGGLVIDTPGMREFHLWLAGDSLEEAFPDIAQLALACKFTDCTHTNERACAVLAAEAAGQLTPERRQNFLKLKRELTYLERASRYRPRKSGSRPRDYLARHDDDWG